MAQSSSATAATLVSLLVTNIATFDNCRKLTRDVIRPRHTYEQYKNEKKPGHGNLNTISYVAFGFFLTFQRLQN